jgi:hypothetical protein
MSGSLYAAQMGSSCAALRYFGGSLAELFGSCREIEYFMFAVLPCQKNR